MSHGLDLLGILATAWPFLLACLGAWVVLGVLGDRGYGARAAVVSWLVTWLGGLGIRLLAGDTAQGAFVVVAGIALAVLLFGWRGVHRLVRRGRASA
ncbi:DUF3054 domain-containing protein [uncultured Tessaracoccus sp.]|uniref:DUF3054 domain-containing protein n=1 Tax=uncultured Tessaracoccus sp. TaxID=905023 RepID=UPI00345BE09F